VKPTGKNGKKAEPEKTEPAAPPDVTKPFKLRMVRTSEVFLNAQNGSKMLAVGVYMANDAGVDGVVEELVHHPSGTVVAKVVNSRSGAVKYVVIRGEIVAEVL